LPKCIFQNAFFENWGIAVGLQARLFTAAASSKDQEVAFFSDIEE
jgi:hypothetical protein